MENKNITILSQYAQSNLSKIVFSLLGIILLSVSSKISIPFYPVPMTLQTFVVYFIAASMGMVGFYATVSYVILGLIGLPIFAAGGGFGYVMSPTFGFLYGMILASFVIAYFSKNLFNKNLIKIILSIFIGALIIFICGIALYSALSAEASRLGAQVFARYASACDLGAAFGPVIGWGAYELVGTPNFVFILGAGLYAIGMFSAFSAFRQHE